jgi:hypothetical protein
VLQLLSEIDTRELVERLIQLMERFRAEEDPLSRSLLEWGRDVSRITLAYGENEEKFLEELALKVHELGSIAISKIDYATLKEPVVANGRVWESWVLEHMRVCFAGVSPYDDFNRGQKVLREEESPLPKESDPFADDSAALARWKEGDAL